MAKFMLLLRSDPNAMKGLSPTDMQKRMQSFRDWSQQLVANNQMRGGDKLADDAGKVVESRSGRIAVKDGPFAETKDVIGGYFLIEAPGYDAAVTIAQGCPLLRGDSTIEVRALQEM
jgi:hypothetical protein